MSTTLPRTATTTPRFEESVLFCMSALHLSFRRIGASLRRQEVRQIQACHPNAVVGHAVVDVETIRRPKIVAPVDAGGEHHVGYGPTAFERQLRSQHRLRGTIADEARMLIREHHHPGGV